MLSSLDGKKVSLLGFLLYFVIDILYVIELVFDIVTGGMDISIFQGLLNIASYFALLIAAGGYLLEWLRDRDMLDFLTGGLLGVSVLITFCNSFLRLNYGFLWIIMGIIKSGFYLALALRASRYNRLFTLLLGCAFLFRAFSGYIVTKLVFVESMLPYSVTYLIWFAGFAICSGLCFLECKQEQ